MSERHVIMLPRGLREEDAALYVGLKPSKFRQMIADGRMPKPTRIDGCCVWDVKKLDAAFDDLDETRNEWDGR